MPFPAFDRTRLKIQPLSRRVHDMDLSELLPLDAPLPPFEHPALPILGERLALARATGSARIMMLGAHVLKAGVSRYLIDLMERGLVNQLALNGAGPIHDWELALIGATTESVARYIRTGEFGLWQETGWMNDVIRTAAGQGTGLGEAPERARRRGAPRHPSHRPCRHRVRHCARTSQLRRCRPGPDKLPGFSHIYADCHVSGRGSAAQFRLRRNGAGSLPQGPGNGP
jgi:hypothetical protein